VGRMQQIWRCSEVLKRGKRKYAEGKK